MSDKKRFILIGITVIVMVTLVVVIGERVRSHGSDTHGAKTATPHLEEAPHELLTFDNNLKPPATTLPATALPQSGAAIRPLKVVYERRAYAGAPPIIPHDVDPSIDRDMTCTVCHEKGGFVPKFNAYTPITPHPKLKACTQCHVPQAEVDLFVETTWKSVEPPAIKRAALPGSPPAVPHTLQLRENCLSCHSGPAAPPEIRTPHPERLACTQCHVPHNADDLFQRPEPEVADASHE